MAFYNPYTLALPVPVIGPDCCFVWHILETTEPTGSRVHEAGTGTLSPAIGCMSAAVLAGTRVPAYKDQSRHADLFLVSTP